VKLPVHAWRTFWAYHAWAGIAAGLALHLMFLCGAITLFREPLGVWEEPVQHRAARDTRELSPQVVFERGLAAIHDLPAIPRRLWLGVPQGEAGVARFQYSDARTGAWRAGWIEPSGRFTAEREPLTTFLYHLHYLALPGLAGLAYLAGVLALVFLLAVATGVLIHLKDLGRQLWQFRPATGHRVRWSDMHKVLGVMGLPFQIAVCYTGALVVFGPVLLTAMSGPVLGRDRDAISQVVWNEPVMTGAAPGPGPVRSLDDVLRIARDHVPGFEPLAFGVQDFGGKRPLARASGTIAGEGDMSAANVLIDLSTGAVLQVDTPATDLASHATRRWLSGIHFAYFGGTAMRIVLAMLAFAGCATILTGNWIWLARNRAVGAAGRPHLLARLTAGIGAGSLVAVAAMFVASRVLPMADPGRGAIEQGVFGGALVACVAWAVAARSSSAVWWQQLGLAGLAMASVPLWAARVSPSGLFGGGPRIATVAAVDAGILVAGGLLLGLAVAVRRASRRDPDPEPAA
jgi:uncharacterized iron-regulated membrane protein